jgi:hypothetical protein
MLTNIKKTPPTGFVTQPDSVPRAPSLYVCCVFFSAIWYYVILCLLLQFWCLILVAWYVIFLFSGVQFCVFLQSGVCDFVFFDVLSCVNDCFFQQSNHPNVMFLLK